jgi:hypothetical protein
LLSRSDGFVAVAFISTAAQAVAPWVGLVCHALRCIVIGCDFRGNFENSFHSTQAKASGSTFAVALTQ